MPFFSADPTHISSASLFKSRVWQLYRSVALYLFLFLYTGVRKKGDGEAISACVHLYSIMYAFREKKKICRLYRLSRRVEIVNCKSCKLSKVPTSSLTVSAHLSGPKMARSKVPCAVGCTEWANFGTVSVRLNVHNGDIYFFLRKLATSLQIRL